MPSAVGEAPLGAAGGGAVDAGSAGAGEAGCAPLITAEGLGAAVPVSVPPCSTAAPSSTLFAPCSVAAAAEGVGSRAPGVSPEEVAGVPFGEGAPVSPAGCFASSPAVCAT
ncbi:hypothetical protein, partial [Aeromonas dhakensis]|uniref:hypothetical protein n=1 Tax=Aeromonas dhakensis TaxID=196024 RepID=UPI001C86D5F3